MEPHTGVSCAMTRHARGTQHRGERRGPRGNGGGGSQQPAETWGGECGSFWSQRKLRNGRDHRRCAAQIRCTEPSDIPLAHRHCPPGQCVASLGSLIQAQCDDRGRPTFGGDGHRPGSLVFSRNQASHAFAHEPRLQSHTRSFETPAPRMRAQPQAQPIRLGRPIPTASSKRSIVGIK